jgi:hypothetical protein
MTAREESPCRTDKSCRILIGLNTGVYEAIDLSQWIAGNPLDVLATNFGKPAPLFERFPRDRVFIAPTGAPRYRAREINNDQAGPAGFGEVGPGVGCP